MISGKFSLPKAFAYLYFYFLLVRGIMPPVEYGGKLNDKIQNLSLH